MEKRKVIRNSGLGIRVKKGAQPFILKDGTRNILFKNGSKSINSLYAYLIDISWGRFFLWVGLGYFMLNLLFASVYLIVGIEELKDPSDSFWEDLTHAFYFSAQTITTVGYGAMAPKGILSGMISSFEALVGLLSFSFVTGLLYGRFSRPKAGVTFSDQIIVRPFNEGKALMFRLMSSRGSIMIEPEVSCTLSTMVQQESGGFRRQFFQMELNLSKINYLPAMWTLVYEIKQGSPLFELSDEEISDLSFEIYVKIKYFDEVYSDQVYQLGHYTNEELEFNRQFVPSYSHNEDGVLEVNHLDLSRTEPLSGT